MVNSLSVTLRCPRHRVALAWDSVLGLWKCPVEGCPYMQPGDPPNDAEQGSISVE